MKERIQSCERGGFTLIEVIVTLVLAGLVITTLIMALQTTISSWGRIRNVQAMALLSQDMMGEIRSRKYTDSVLPTHWGPEAGETNRITFNDVDDYDGFSNSPPQTMEGVVLTNLSDIAVSVVVDTVPGTNLFVTMADNSTSAFKRISILLSAPGLMVTNVSVVSKYD